MSVSVGWKCTECTDCVGVTDCVSAAILQLLPLAGSFSITDNLFSSVATTEPTYPLADCPPNLHITNCYHALRR